MYEQAISLEIEAYNDVIVARPDLCLKLFDDISTGIYLPFRGPQGCKTERAIIPAEAHVPHQENDAEHTFHLATTANQLWQQKDRLGMVFPDAYDPYKALSYILDHDVPEIGAGDVDSMTRDSNLTRLKHSGERAAADLIRLTYPSLSPIVENWEQYEKKLDAESRFVYDLDKLLPIRVICADGGRRWHNWNGESTSKQFMVERVRKKLLTPFGIIMMDAIEDDLAEHPEYFPDECTYQERLF